MMIKPLIDRITTGESSTATGPGRILLIVITIAAFFITMNAAAGDVDPTFSATDGRVITNFGGFGSITRKVLVQPDGKLIVVGKGTTANSGGDFSLARYNPDGSLDTSFDGDGKVSTAFGIQDSFGRGAILQPDGKIIVVGEARASNPSGSDFGIITYNSDGSIDLTFGTAGKVFTSFTPTSSDYANDVVLQSDGKIVVSGNSDAAFAIARYNADGSLDPSFDTDGKAIVMVANQGNNNTSIAIQSDGKIVVGGSVTVSNPPQEAQFLIGLARFNTDGSPDTAFDGDGKLTTAFGVYANCGDIAIQPDGKILAAGAVDVGTSSGLDLALVRYNPDGSLDTQLNGSGKVSTLIGNFDDHAFAVALQPDGRIVLAGDTRINSDDTDFSLVRYDINGALDPSFGVNGKVVTTAASIDAVASVAVLPDGQIAAAGNAAAIAAPSMFAVVRYSTSGVVDQGFGFKVPGRTNTVVRGMIDEANAVLIQPDGKIVSGGRSRVTNRYNFSLTRQNPNGTLDAQFGSGGTVNTKIGVGDTDSEVRAIELQPDGKIIAVGRLFDANNINQSLFYFAMARYNANGSLDTSFDGDGIKVITAPAEDNRAFAVAVQADGKILIAGYNDITVGGPTSFDMAVVRLLPDGALDTTFDSDGIVTADMGSAADIAYSMKLQADGKIIIGGVGGANPDFALLRLNPDGSPDSTFGTSGKVFTPVGTSIDEIRSILIQPDGKIVAVGFARVGALNDFAVVRYNPDGSLDLAFGTGGKVITPIEANATDTAMAVVLQNDSKIIAVGTSTITTNSNLAVVRYLANGTPDVSFGGDGIITTDYAGLGNANETATAAAMQSDGKLVVVGGIRDRTSVGIANDRRDFLTVRYLTNARTPFDYDGDGKSDVSVFRPSTGTWYLNRSTAGIYGLTWGFSTDVITPADFDGDGKTDVAVFRPSEGRWYIFNSATSTFGTSLWGAATDIPAPADYDGDGKADISIFRPSDGNWWLNRSTAGTTTIPYGQNGDIPAVGDYDGDGKADVAVFRPSNGVWSIHKSGGGDTGYQFGFGTDKITQADYDGDGKTDIAIYRPSTGQWFIANSATPTYPVISFGNATDIPAPGDYDGDGKADVAIFRPSDGNWWLNRSTAGVTVTQFGQSGDKPTQNAYGN